MLAFPVKSQRLCEMERGLILYSSPLNWSFTGCLTTKGNNHPSSSSGSQSAKNILIMFWQKQKGKGSVILRWKNDTQILNFYHTEYEHRELFTSGIKDNYALLNLHLSLTSSNMPCIFARQNELYPGQKHLPSKSLLTKSIWVINLNLGFRQERMTDVQHLSPVVIISWINSKEMPGSTGVSPVRIESSTSPHKCIHLKQCIPTVGSTLLLC